MFHSYVSHFQRLSCTHSFSSSKCFFFTKKTLGSGWSEGGRLGPGSDAQIKTQNPKVDKLNHWITICQRKKVAGCWITENHWITEFPQGYGGMCFPFNIVDYYVNHYQRVNTLLVSLSFNPFLFSISQGVNSVSFIWATKEVLTTIGDQKKASTTRQEGLEWWGVAVNNRKHWIKLGTSHTSHTFIIQSCTL